MVSNEPRPSESTPAAGPPASDAEAIARRSLPPEAGELAPLRSWLVDSLALDVPADKIQLFLVAVTETGTNAIEAHRRSGIERSIDVSVDSRAKIVSVRDHGRGLGDRAVDDPELPPPSAERGRGLLITQTICPDARFVDTGSGTLVELPYPS